MHAGKSTEAAVDAHLCPSVNGVVAQLAVTVSDQVVHATHQEADLLAAGLLPFDPGDLVPPDVFSRVAFLADQLSVREAARVVQGFDVVQHALSDLGSQEVLHHADAVLVHARNYALRSQFLRRRAALPVGRGALAGPVFPLPVTHAGCFGGGRRRAVSPPGGYFGVSPGRLRVPGLLTGKLRLLTTELVLLPVLFLVLFAAVEGTPAPAALEEVLHFPTKFTVLSLSLRVALLLLHVRG